MARVLTGLVLLVACTEPRVDPDTGVLPDTDVEVDTDVEADTDTDTDTDADTDTDTDTDRPVDPLEALRLPGSQPADGVHTRTSAVCADCHSNSDGSIAMRDSADRPVGPHDVWKGSLMAHAARDPLFRATLAAEQAATPSRSAEIAAKCLRCHAPLAAIEAELGEPIALTPELLRADDPHGDLARDGASCLSCHLQSPDEGLGDDATWSGAHRGRR